MQCRGLIAKKAELITRPRPKNVMIVKLSEREPPPLNDKSENRINKMTPSTKASNRVKVPRLNTLVNLKLVRLLENCASEIGAPG